MNKYTKNKIFFNLEKIICLTVASAFVILMIACITTSCSPMQSTYKIDYDKVKKNKDKYEWVCADFTK